MRKIFSILLVLVFLGCSAEVTKNESIEIVYSIDVNNHEDDLFHVTVDVSDLTSENNIYNIPATAPGTYQIMDFGNFVLNFKALDADGNEIGFEKISTNQWKIYEPEKLDKLVYDVEDTFDSKLVDYPIAPMSGTAINDNFVIINSFGVIGYFENLQDYPSKLKIDYQAHWELGTALAMDEDGFLISKNYNHLADSPILIGQLTFAEIMVGKVPVEVYVYSSDTSVTANKVLSLADEVLQSSEEFIGYDAAPFYKFLMVLPNMQEYATMNLYGGGALEHNLSSLYVMPVSPQEMPGLRSTMAHEFLHILSPLNLSSEVIHHYNFVEPQPSKHIWLYEGVTEWASDIMQLRGGIYDYDTFFNQISEKMSVNDQFDPPVSLVDMALNSYSESGYGHFYNFYNKGALTATCLDIELLRLSGGKTGLRELYIELLQEYGQEKPFEENEFFQVIVDKTYPEIENFINSYIKGAEVLPCAKYFGMLGFDYIPEKISDDPRPALGVNFALNSEKEIIFQGIRPEGKEFGFREGDVLVEILDEKVTLESMNGIIQRAYTLKVGDEYIAKVRRDGELLNIHGKFLQRKKKHIFEEMDNLTPEQKILRESWSKNI